MRQTESKEQLQNGGIHLALWVAIAEGKEICVNHLVWHGQPLTLGTEILR